MRPDSLFLSPGKNLKVDTLFYAPAVSGSSHELDEEESKHCIRVLRLSRGDLVYLTDGLGHLFECTIVLADLKKCRLTVNREIQAGADKGWRLHIAIAPPKNPERFEWFLEKSTEIGIDEITPLICDRSERRITKPERQEKLIISAMKQSQRLFLPKLNRPVDFTDIARTACPGLKFIAHCETGNGNDLGKLYKAGEEVLVLIGPEGDFSARELAAAKENGFVPVSLGSHRLRTETAGIAACHTINLINQISIRE
jgi:16S rRNA (uracil1498-N3)-methyltransferase